MLPENVYATYVHEDGTVTDACVLCLVDTKIPTETPVAERKYYVEGVGQLCPKCAKEHQHV